MVWCLPSSSCSPSSGRKLQAHVVANPGPLGCLLHQHDVNEAEERGSSREDPDPPRSAGESPHPAAFELLALLRRHGCDGNAVEAQQTGFRAWSRCSVASGGLSFSTGFLGGGPRRGGRGRSLTAHGERVGPPVAPGGLRLLVDGSARPVTLSGGRLGSPRGGLAAPPPRAARGTRPRAGSPRAGRVRGGGRPAPRSNQSGCSDHQDPSGHWGSSDQLASQTAGLDEGSSRRWCVPAWPPTAGSTWVILVSRS